MAVEFFKWKSGVKAATHVLYCGQSFPHRSSSSLSRGIDKQLIYIAISIGYIYNYGADKMY